jgi:uncharacterized OB-fold protein
VSPNRLLPPANPVSAPYWDAARRHQLVLQRCDQCERYIFHPRATCPHCGGRHLQWVPASGRGVVHTFTIARRPTHPAFTDQVPYVIAVVQLEEGPLMTTNIIGCDPADVSIGQSVTVEFEDVDGEGIALPVFRAAVARQP